MCSQGIKDEFIKEVNYRGTTEAELQKVDKFLVNCYNNIALVLYKTNDYHQAIQACDCAIAIDGTNDKSYLLRSQARLAPKSAGAFEQELAMSDLETAFRNNPESKEIR